MRLRNTVNRRWQPPQAVDDASGIHSGVRGGRGGARACGCDTAAGVAAVGLVVEPAMARDAFDGGGVAHGDNGGSNGISDDGDVGDVGDVGGEESCPLPLSWMSRVSRLACSAMELAPALASQPG